MPNLVIRRSVKHDARPVHSFTCAEPARSGPGSGQSSNKGVRAGLVAIADQSAGHGLGLINPKLYSLASGPNYGTYFYDVTTGNNQADPTVPGFPATIGWDPVTGLGTPNAAALVPALAS